MCKRCRAKRQCFEKVIIQNCSLAQSYPAPTRTALFSGRYDSNNMTVRIPWRAAPLSCTPPVSRNVFSIHYVRHYFECGRPLVITVRTPSTHPRTTEGVRAKRGRPKKYACVFLLPIHHRDMMRDMIRVQIIWRYKFSKHTSRPIQCTYRYCYLFAL